MPGEQANGSDRLRGLIERLMGQLGEFGGNVHAAQEKCREKYRRIEPEPRNRLRIMIDGLMAMLAEAVTTPIASVNEVIVSPVQNFLQLPKETGAGHPGDRGREGGGTE